MLYSNLLKNGTTVVSGEKKCLIDSNELIAKKLEIYQKQRDEQAKSGFHAGLSAQELELTEPAEGEESDQLSAILSQEPVYEGPDPEQLLAEAREQIEQMEQEAKAALEAERRKVLEDARQEGYTMGFQQGQEQGMAQADSLKQSLEKEKAGLEAEYQQRIEELEPKFIDTLTGIYEHLFQVELSGYRDIIVHLVTAALSRIEGGRDYLIHVSKEDFGYVNMQKREIQANSMIGNATMEIIEDISLHKNECLIETEGGIFDCGLGTQLSELTRKLKLLSYEKE